MAIDASLAWLYAALSEISYRRALTNSATLLNQFALIS